MNVAPLTPWQRSRMIDRLAEGLGPRAAQTMHDTLSDGHLRTIYTDLYQEEPPVDLELQRQSFNARAA